MSDADFMTLSQPTAEQSDYGQAMLETLSELHSMQPERPSTVALIRHSARHYGQAENDLDNPLSDQGRALCATFGRALPQWERFSTWASSAERCLETAELVAASHDHPQARVNGALNELTVFYVRDMRKVGGMMRSLGPREMLRRWFAGEIAADIMQPPEEAAARVLRELRRLVRQAGDNHLTLCVSHDWTVYLLRHACLNLRFGEHPPAEYLDGIVFWMEGDELMGKTSLCEASPINPL